jgi:hypothetical protein
MTKSIANMGPSADVGVMSVAMSMAQSAGSEKGPDPDRSSVHQVDQTAQASRNEQVRLNKCCSSIQMLTVQGLTYRSQKSERLATAPKMDSNANTFGFLVPPSINRNNARPSGNTSVERFEYNKTL